MDLFYANLLVWPPRKPRTGPDAVPRPDWEVYVERLASLIAKEHSPEKLLEARGMLYELLVHLIPPSMLLVSLTKGLLARADDALRVDIVHWAAYYEHRLRLGNKPIFHLEGGSRSSYRLHLMMCHLTFCFMIDVNVVAFVAKVMSIYKNFSIGLHELLWPLFDASWFRGWNNLLIKRDQVLNEQVLQALQSNATVSGIWWKQPIEQILSSYILPLRGNIESLLDVSVISRATFCTGSQNVSYQTICLYESILCWIQVSGGQNCQTAYKMLHISEQSGDHTYGCLSHLLPSLSKLLSGCQLQVPGSALWIERVDAMKKYFGLGLCRFHHIGSEQHKELDMQSCHSWKCTKSTQCIQSWVHSYRCDTRPLHPSILRCHKYVLHIGRCALNSHCTPTNSRLSIETSSSHDQSYRAVMSVLHEERLVYNYRKERSSSLRAQRNCYSMGLTMQRVTWWGKNIFKMWDVVWVP